MLKKLFSLTAEDQQISRRVELTEHSEIVSCSFLFYSQRDITAESVCSQGRLAGVGGEDLPTIVVVAHYDSFGVAPVCFFFPNSVITDNLDTVRGFVRKYLQDLLK